jgi:hypothetical protein
MTGAAASNLAHQRIHARYLSDCVSVVTFRPSVRNGYRFAKYKGESIIMIAKKPL